MRRLGHTRHLTDNEEVTALKIPRDLNVADCGTHYNTAQINRSFEAWFRGAGHPP